MHVDAFRGGAHLFSSDNENHTVPFPIVARINQVDNLSQQTTDIPFTC